MVPVKEPGTFSQGGTFPVIDIGKVEAVPELACTCGV